MEKRLKIAKKGRKKNSTIKALFTILVLSMKIQGGHGPLPPVADAHGPKLRE